MIEMLKSANGDGKSEMDLNAGRPSISDWV